MSLNRLSSLRVHLLVIVTLAVSPALLMVAHMSWESRRNVEVRAELAARRLAEYIEGQHRLLVENTRRTLQQMATSDIPSGVTDPTDAESFFLHAAQGTALLNIGRVETNGVVTQSALGPTAVNVANELWFQRVMNSDPFWCDNRTREPVGGQSAIICAVPIAAPGKSVEGVLFATLNMDWLRRVPITSDALSEARLDMFNDAGIWIANNAHASTNRPERLPVHDFDKVPRTGHTRAFTEQQGPKNDDVLRVLHRVPGVSPKMDSLIAISVPLAKLRAQAQIELANKILVLGAAVLLSLLLAWLTSERLVLRRTRALVRATERLGAGDLSARTGLGASGGKHDEIGELARKFDTMAEQLQSEQFERAKLEEQVRIAQKLEAMGLLAGGVAHDFNNLLQVISGSTTLAQQSVPPANPAGHHLDNVRQAADRAAALTKQLLAVSRQQPLDRQSVELNEMVSSLLQMIRRVIGTHIEVTFHYHGTPAWVNADRGQLEQVLLNLCLNARDAMPDGGKLELSAFTVVVEANDPVRPTVRPGAYYEITVQDSGTGIPPALLPRIFDPFFTTKAKDRGTGLGLSVVYGIVRQHEGHISVESTVGTGTTFHVLLPQSAAPKTVAAPAQAKQAPTRGTETVLVAEDEELVRELTLHILNEAGYKVLAATNGVEACELFAKHSDQISIVILDAIMPRMGGREAAQRIREAKPEMTILFCSGYSGAALESDHALAPHEMLLTKPYQPIDLLRRVRDVLDRKPEAVAA